MRSSFAIEAFNARDIEAFIAYFDSSCEVHSGFAALNDLGVSEDELERLEP